MTWLRLDQANGPQCPDCGCRDTELLIGTAVGTWFGGCQLSRPPTPIPPEHATQGAALCGHCGRRFAVRLVDGPVDPQSADVLYSDEEPIVDEAVEIAEDLVAAKKVPMVRMRCPSCQSIRVRVQSTKKPEPPSTRTWRNHVCLDCEYTFQSFEETVLGE